ncbi:MAG TPA: PKD domain-containing protein, partial [candidate division Zixibacteria bacterium]|nr:PKD domain-containing protein [candidate division Zixibacteria bacterium]
TLIIIATALSLSTVSATIIHVPTDQSTIQDGINAAVSGDTVLVAPGEYIENITFDGKDILLTSNFLLTHHQDDIYNTIINGSQPATTDTGSVVRFVNGETNAAVLQGFTITGGIGSKVESFNGGTWREGGGILARSTSPVIRNNRIVYNYANSFLGGVNGAGGGGFKSEFGAPILENNVIAYNYGMFGNGIVMNHPQDGVIRNNLIYENHGGWQWGGGGINIAYSTASAYIDNNTIINNSDSSAFGGGGILAFGSGAVVIARNNIVWGNYGGQVNKTQAGGVLDIQYCNIEGGFAGIGNTNVPPDYLLSEEFYLLPTSPCVDAGDTALGYNDVEDSANPGAPQIPALGDLRNDMGAYGGPYADMGSFGARLAIDTNFGVAPLIVNFTGVSEQAVTYWNWDFGDGSSVDYPDSEPISSTAHEFTAPGLYSIEVTLTTDTGDIVRSFPDAVGLHDDSLIPLDAVAAGGALARVDIYARNYLPLTRLIIPFSWSGPLGMTFDHNSTDGLRSDHLQSTFLSYNAFGKTAVFQLTAQNGEVLEPGAGPVVSFYFELASGGADSTASLSVTPVESHTPACVSTFGPYELTGLSGTITRRCCATPGDANHDGKFNISDVTFDINWIFTGAVAPPCQDEADADGSNAFNISDVTYGITRIFSGGPAPVCGSTGS